MPRIDPEWVMITLTAIYVGVTICAFVVIKKQGSHMAESINLSRQQIALAKETAQRQLRAYVCVHESLLKFPHVGIGGPTAIPMEAMPNAVRNKVGAYGPPEGKVEAQIHIKNCGQTPAYDVRIWIHTWYGTYPLKAPLPTPPEGFRMSSAVLESGGKTIMISPEKPALSKEEMNLLGSKPEYTMYVYGKITYRDIFEEIRYTNYRLMYGGPEGRKTFVRDEVWGMLQPDTEGNDAD
jgi:hypothetical protein